jgi:hypothetical protein
MGQLFQLSVIIILVGSNGFADARKVCPLKVTVVNDNNLDVESLITVVEKSGRKHILENAVGGVEFCDLGILPVKVQVGEPTSCLFTTVEEVWIE